jgi:trehalose-phosphatase
MRHWRNGIEEFKGLVEADLRLGLVSDLDGTLSHIVDVPNNARMSGENAKLLNALAAVEVLIAIISGRGVEDLAKRVDIVGAILIGNHGMERWVDGKAVVAEETMAFRPQLAGIRAELEKIEEKGLRLEDKQASIALHYRQVGEPALFRNKELEKLEGLAEKYALAFSEGRMIFEFKAALAINKGSALRSIVEENNLGALFYIGDDVTDISALKMIQNMRSEGQVRGYGIGVKSAEGNQAVIEAADYVAEGVEDVEAFLVWLLDARNASST